jgi:hypothetical protein
MTNDLWLILIGPALITGVYGFAWLVDRFWGDCQHKWDDWTAEVTEYAYVQHRKCVKCGYIQTEQFKKLTP